MTPTLQYETLVKDYYENLHTTLRKFSQGHDFLDTWVHDEDHNRSVLGIFESAGDSALEGLTLQLSKKTQTALNTAWLKTELAKIGSVQFKESADKLEIQLTFGK